MRVGPFATAAVVLFWLLMNGLVLRDAAEYRGLDQYRRGVIDFLGKNVRRERWMGIYRKSRRLGHTGFSIERRFDQQGMGYRMDFSTRVEIDIWGRGGAAEGGTGAATGVEIDGWITLDAAVIPEEVHAKVAVGPARLTLAGARREGHFHVALKNAEDRIAFQTKFPLREIQLGDALAPLPPVSGLSVGQVYRVNVFDPIFHEDAMAETTVKAAARKEADGILVDCFELETRLRGIVFRSFVTRDGEVLRQELPPDIILLRESRRPR